MPFQYALLRAVPRVDRGEQVNVGLVLYCQQAEFLDCLVRVRADRLRALDPETDVAAISAAVAAFERWCHTPVGSARHGSGLATRFGMLVAPRSTVLQPGPVHAGLTDAPADTLGRLVRRLVD
ncbi:DUF3037 domain-containing protein [Propionibacteriaceae bacterium Y2011]|uniref:DUF3037 domain-containing protein n=1 Tax=Microlunatus sp. Y2014 TaxID=3418488 RepID=UPI003B48C639